MIIIKSATIEDIVMDEADSEFLLPTQAVWRYLLLILCFNILLLRADRKSLLSTTVLSWGVQVCCIKFSFSLMEIGVSSLHGVVNLVFAKLPEDPSVPIVLVPSSVLLT